MHHAALMGMLQRLCHFTSDPCAGVLPGTAKDRILFAFIIGFEAAALAGVGDGSQQQSVIELRCRFAAQRVEPFGQGHSLDQLHRKVRDAILLATAEWRHDAWVSELRDSIDLALEVLTHAAKQQLIRSQHLERDTPPCRWLLREEDGAYTTLPQHALDLKFTKGFGQSCACIDQAQALELCDLTSNSRGRVWMGSADRLDGRAVAALASL
ncbi:MAG: hypothetical protein ACI841_004920 [Planctomycetota bacterium]|jgi:hypothetical protein